jgi:aspartyl-tRNA(Asn)/glutamyl-tRNA(Gln) amidotransferase subunit C
MMPVTIADVDYVAALAKLSFSAEEKVRLTEELNGILEYMDQLRTLDTGDVNPLAQVIEWENVLRDDILRPGLSREEAVANAPSQREDFFRVPKAIGDR